MKKIILHICIISSQTLMAQNVGIGITAPLSKLHVYAGASGGTPYLSALAVEGNAHTYINILSPAANETGILFGIPGVPYAGAIVYNNLSTPNGLQLRTNGNQTRMVIDSSGNVGVGTFTPKAKLSISFNGTELVGTAFGNTLRTNAGVLGSTAGSELSLANVGFLSTNHSSLGIRAYRSSAGTGWASTALLLGYDVDNTVRAGGGLIALSANGNIGIGTTNPLQILHVEGATFLNGNVGIGNSTPAVALSFGPVLGDKISLWSNSANSYGFGIQGSLLQIHTDIAAADIAFGYGSSDPFTEVMRIKGTGNVGIGTSIPSAAAALDVSSTTKGFLPPRMTSTQRDLIASPAEGLIIYNTTIKAVQFYNGTSWFVSTHYIGESYGGGIVFYVYDNGQHGLIAATADQSNNGIRWYGGTYTHTRARANGVGAGFKNTCLIIANQAMVDGNSFAATVCNEYSVTAGGVNYGDWYLPSRYELDLLYLQRGAVGGFINSFYWSSTEDPTSNSSNAWLISFPYGTNLISDKQGAFYVRAIRAF